VEEGRIKSRNPGGKDSLLPDPTPYRNQQHLGQLVDNPPHLVDKHIRKPILLR
jgi:hypothetical protein